MGIACKQVAKSYYLKNILLRVYNNERYLATVKHDSSITQIEDVNVGNAELDINVEDVVLIQCN